MISLRKVSYAYPDADQMVLHGLDLEVAKGTICGVVGASGAGKTTLAKILSGFIPHAEGGELSGTVAAAGIRVPETPLVQIIEHVGLVTQNPFNQISGAKFSVREEIAFGLENLGVHRAAMLRRIEQVGRLLRIDHLMDRSPYALSGGQMQLVAIASMLVMNPAVLVMDEPTSQLDPGGTRMVFDVVHQLTRTGTTVVMFEHKLEQLRDHADHIVVLAGGAIQLAGPPRRVLSDDRLAEWGVGSTRYTQAARVERSTASVPSTDSDDAGQFPVSFADAITYFATTPDGD